MLKTCFVFIPKIGLKAFVYRHSLYIHENVTPPFFYSHFFLPFNCYYITLQERKQQNNDHLIIFN